MSDLIRRQAAIEAMRKCQTYRFSATEPRMIMLAAAEEVIEELPSAQPDNDMIHLQKEQAYLQGWEEGREALRKEKWEDGRDRLD